MKRKLPGLIGFIILISNLTGCITMENKQNKEDIVTSKDRIETEETEKEFSGTTLTILNHSSATPDGVLEKVCEEAEKKFGFDIKVEACSSDSIVKTRLATGQCPDLLVYNTGSLLSTLHPEEFFMDITEKNFTQKFDKDFFQAASVDGVLYGIPQCDNMGCGVYYNKELYEEYNLDVPETWSQFKKNMDILKEHDITGFGIALRDLVSVQLPFLAGNYQIMYQNPEFAEKFTEESVNFSDSKEGLRSWEKYEELVPYFNEDCVSVTNDKIQKRLFENKIGHMIYFTNMIPKWEEEYGDKIEKIGFFALPGDKPEYTGMTTWPANGIYGSKNSKNTKAIEAFMSWYVSNEGLDVLTSFYHPAGIFHTGYQPKGRDSALFLEVEQYYKEGKNISALEYMTPVKGINCQEICNKLGSGQLSSKGAAAAYDEDCKKTALQLGLWF